MKIRCLKCLFLFTLIAFIFGCNNNKVNNTPTTPPKQNTNPTSNQQPETKQPVTAKQLFTEHCQGCHGQESNDFIQHDWKYGNSKQEIIQSINNGMVENGMPAYNETFTPTEVEKLADYILNDIKQQPPETKPIVSKTPNTKLITVATDLQIPWAIEVTKDGTIYFTERQGTFNYIPPGGQPIRVSGVPEVVNKRQGGMLDVKLHPKFSENKQVFLSYSKPGDRGKSTTAVTRATLQGSSLTDMKDIFIALPYHQTQHHYGSRMAFDKDGYLFITVGDRGNRSVFPQTLDNGCGKVHRINDDGTIPTDNPFYNTPGAIQSIWSYGHRNPQGMVYDAVNQSLLEHEHGPKGGDEVNLVQKGLNYGWPVITYGVNYSGIPITKHTEKQGMQQPITHWTPSIAPSGMDLVTGNRYGNWEGSLLSGSLKFDFISKIVLKDNKLISEEKVFEGIGRLREIEMGDDGFLYIGVENPGRIIKVAVVD